MRARVEIDAIALGSGRAAPPGERAATVVDAAVFLAAAAVTTGTVVIRNWHELVDNGRAEILCESLAGMGAYVVKSAEGLTCTTRSTSGHLEGITTDLHSAPELLPVLATLAAMADSPSHFTGVAAHPALDLMRGNLRVLGGLTRATGTSLDVLPRPLHQGRWRGEGDDHVSILGAVVGLVVPGVEVSGVDVRGNGLNRFLHTWQNALNADEHILPGTTGGTLPYYH